MDTKEEIRLAERALSQIGRIAKSGDLDALAALRDLACKAADMLANLTDPPHDHPDTPASIREGSKKAKELARDSRRWPCALDALAEKRKNQLAKWDALEVGGAIGIRLSGKNRGFDYWQKAGFALDLFERLEAERKNPDPWHADIFEAFPSIEKDLLAEFQESRKCWIIEKEKGLEELRKVPSWQTYAAKLPPLSMESLKQWTEAGLEICRADCEGNFDNFEFPKAITCKAGRKTEENGHLRTIESAIREKISEGLKALISS
jgi:hypothetical protein